MNLDRNNSLVVTPSRNDNTLLEKINLLRDFKCNNYNDKYFYLIGEKSESYGEISEIFGQRFKVYLVWMYQKVDLRQKQFFKKECHCLGIKSYGFLEKHKYYIGGNTNN